MVYCKDRAGNPDLSLSLGRRGECGKVQGQSRES